jgi:hypothetical protein
MGAVLHEAAPPERIRTTDGLARARSRVCSVHLQRGFVMGAHRSTFGKLERDRAKKAKAAIKRERRQSRATEEGTAEDESRAAVKVADDALSPGDLLRMVESLHREFEAKLISFEDYEERKADILSRLPVD